MAEKRWIRCCLVAVAASGGLIATTAAVSAQPLLNGCPAIGSRELCTFVDLQDGNPGPSNPRDRVSESFDTPGQSDATGGGVACGQTNVWWLSAGVIGYAQVLQTPLPVNCP
ncbi:MAG: hypothetical protein ACYDH6_11210 [Acidimicrobiales bacterium]